MGTKIEWCNYFPGYRGETLNMITGCTPVSAGCENCYARRMSKRLAGRFGYPADEPFRPGTLHRDAYYQALSWEKPRVVFVSSMGDLFHKNVCDLDLANLWTLMLERQQHLFLLLTKRPENVVDAMAGVWNVARNWPDDLPLPTLLEETGTLWTDNIWLGVTAENQDCADRRIPELLQIPAAKHFVSCEPLLHTINLRSIPLIGGEELDSIDGWSYDVSDGQPLVDHRGKSVDWVIAGAETGPGARKCKLGWARLLREQCFRADTPFFWKKWSDGSREIDGREWNQTPEVNNDKG